ncbi:dihydropteroate synthase [Fictibacillus iocasae]|uniref:Dihydropteroate synthase n=1 Tax=Fictibacillus iocasae TaxID=2715437 RepID=A0ABW2NPE4_9BACL
MNDTLLYNSCVIQAGSHTLDFSKKTYVMGILNATPDSFSDGGKFNHIETAVKHAKQMIADGADIIDVGGESTRPGAEKVGLDEELSRVIPLIEALSKEIPVPISIDTYKAEVARQAILAGAHIINDVWGAKADPLMAATAAELDVPIILMHNRDNTDYEDFMQDMIADLKHSIAIAVKAGVRPENIILDPGIGFVKTYEQNLETMRRLDEIAAIGYPVLLGTSRKSMIGKALDLPVTERMEGTGATVCLGIERGCSIVRVHDVKEIARMTKMMDAMLGRGRS